jgi:hypothetical protein
MNLPQEYWEKQTLFEIASGLGTPLSIDEATQTRRFGIFAIILIDVDLSEKMFDSVVVETDDHALSILVQYEKHPLYCAHCKMLGHSIQTCSKLNISNKSNGVVPLNPKPHSVNNIARTRADLSGRPDLHASGSSMLIGNKAVTSVPDKNQRKGKNPDTQHLESVTEFESEILTSQKLPNQVEIHSDINTSSPKLTLQNSFDLLEEDEHFEEGEAMPGDKEVLPLSLIGNVISSLIPFLRII